MAYSLLAHLFPYIKGSQEDIATFSLQYLLTQSEKLNLAFTKRVADCMSVSFENTLKYDCQVTGDSDEKERPDMAGFDSEGNEIVLFEMKFYASLTQNQPGTYLKRLKQNGGKGLLFVCPMARRTNLWAQLKNLCSEMQVEDVNEFCINVDGIMLSIISWSEIIELLETVAASVDTAFSADIAQLKGYCNQLDSDAFIPFSDQDLSAGEAKKVERYYQVIDEVIDLLCADETLETSKKGTKASSYRKGYSRGLKIDNLTISLYYDRDMWKSPTSIETPFWIAISDSEWYQSEEICAKLQAIPEQQREFFWGLILIGLEALQNATLAEVSMDLKEKIVSYINMIR